MRRHAHDRARRHRGNVALPSIQTDLGFSQSNLAWVINAYMIAFGGLLLLAGRLGDLIGSKRVFVVGLALFTAASLLCGVSWTRDMLVAARFLQGIGGALASSVILSMIVQMFEEPGERAKAMSAFSFTASAGARLLLVGGGLTQIASWHWVFLINVPIDAASPGAALPADGETLGPREGADVAGAALITSSLMLAVYTVVEPGARYWLTLIGAALAAALFAGSRTPSDGGETALAAKLFRSRNLWQQRTASALYGMFGFSSRLLYAPRSATMRWLPARFYRLRWRSGRLISWSAQLAMRFSHAT